MLRIILSSIVGTSFMTVYSYWKAKKQQEQFEEPLMLGKLLHRAYPKKISYRSSKIQGWMLHYTIGGSFNICYDQLWRGTELKPGLKSGLFLGAISGLIGMAAWTTMLHMHRDPPHTHLRKHLQQLFTAHIIFGVTSAMAYRQAQNRMCLEKNSIS